MSTMKTGGSTQGGERENLIDFMARFTSSEQFDRVFREGMSLVEETADYLDGPGREEARKLARPAALSYATESMRLTTRLMQLASWLLLQRAVSCGELTEEAANEEKQRISLADAAPQPMENEEQLPDGLRQLAARSRQLYARIIKLDDMINNRRTPEADTTHPLAAHMNRLAEAFGGK